MEEIINFHEIPTYFNVYIDELRYLIGQQMLVSLQGNIHKKHLKDPRIQPYLESVAGKYNNPFDASPIQWDAQKREIYFLHYLNENDDDPLRIARKIPPFQE